MARTSMGSACRMHVFIIPMFLVFLQKQNSQQKSESFSVPQQKSMHSVRATTGTPEPTFAPRSAGPSRRDGDGVRFSREMGRRTIARQRASGKGLEELDTLISGQDPGVFLIEYNEQKASGNRKLCEIQVGGAGRFGSAKGYVQFAHIYWLCMLKNESQIISEVTFVERQLVLESGNLKDFSQNIIQ